MDGLASLFGQNQQQSIWQISMRNGEMISTGYYLDTHFQIKARVIFLDDEIVEKIARAIESKAKNESVKPKEIRNEIAKILYSEKTMRIKVSVRKMALTDGTIKWYVELSK